MLELVGRCGAARAVRWTHSVEGQDHTVTTPLLLTRPSCADLLPQAGLLVAAAGAPDGADGRPVVAQLGGFHSPAETPDVPGAWAVLHVDRARRMEGQLSLRAGRPVSPISHLDVDEDGPLVQTNAAPAAIPRVRPVSSADGAVTVLPEAASAANDPAVLVPLVRRARRDAGPGTLLLAPGVGLPHQLALLAYAGVDLFDTLAAERAALSGLYVSVSGVYPAADLKAPLDGFDPQMRAPRDLTSAALVAHNLKALEAELTTVRGHIANGTLRELVEQRARVHPGTAAALRHLDHHAADIQDEIPLTGTGSTQLLATAQESLSRPDVARFRDRLRNQYRPPTNADVLLLLPCSARKPYAKSKSHQVFRRVLGELHAYSLIHEVVITSPLGVVPRELENTWPAAHYDVPVTGNWDREETEMIRTQLRALLAVGDYRRVISHLGDSTHALIADLLPEGTVQTGQPHPTAFAARDALRSAVIDATRGVTAPAWPQRRIADAHAMTTWQYGPAAADALFAHIADALGRPPAIRLFEQRPRKSAVATFVPQKGLLALTMTGARHMHEAGVIKTVEIDDFKPKGTVFSVGVRDADPDIVPGEEVVLVHKGELRGVGPALCTGHEMRAFGRGPAVEVRHHA